MGNSTFRGGAHPYEGKELSMDEPIRVMEPKTEMFFPMSQHIGAPAAAIVQKGDHVLAGQKIADAAGFVSSPIHSSVSGTVKGIEPRLTATGSMVNSIIIENDGEYKEAEFVPARLEDLSREEILDRIQFYLNHRSYEQILLGAVIFNNTYGYLGQTADAEKLIKLINAQNDEAQ